MVAQLLGQAYVAAYVLVAPEPHGVEHVADVLIEKREMYGDEVVELLDSLELKVPRSTYSRRSWPPV